MLNTCKFCELYQHATNDGFYLSSFPSLFGPENEASLYHAVLSNDIYVDYEYWLIVHCYQSSLVPRPSPSLLYTGINLALFPGPRPASRHLQYTRSWARNEARQHLHASWLVTFNLQGLKYLFFNTANSDSGCIKHPFPKLPWETRETR